MNFKKLALGTLLALGMTSNVFAGGVNSYVGTISTAGAGISSGAGNSAAAVIDLEFKVPGFIAIGVYDASGAIANALFSAPATNFPGGTTFTSAEASTALLSNEGDLISKFDLDGTTSLADATTIVNAQNATADAASQDIIIKGASYSNLPAVTDLFLTTSVDNITLAGGTGSAPTYNFRAVAGIPGGGASAIAETTAPNGTPLTLDSTKRNANGYSRFAIVGDLAETSVDLTTSGNWTGSFTITLTGL